MLKTDEMQGCVSPEGLVARGALEDRSPGLAPDSLQSLSVALSDSRVAVRRAAIDQLAQSRQGVPMLCSAVEDRSREVSLAAVRALGRSGDPRAVPALRSALRRCYGGGRRWLHPLVTLAWLAGMFYIVVWTALLAFVAVFLTAPLFIGFNWVFWWLWSRWRRDRSEYFDTVQEALERLATSQPTPELRLAMGDLKTLSHSPTVLTRETRVRSRELAGRIDRLTRDLRDLPSPTRAGRPEPAQAEALLRPFQPGRETNRGASSEPYETPRQEADAPNANE